MPAAPAAPGAPAAPAAPARYTSDDESSEIKIEEKELPVLKPGVEKLKMPENVSEIEKEYQKQNAEQWKRYNLRNESTAKVYTMGKCAMLKRAPNSDNGDAGFDRLAVILPDTTERMIIFPNVEGNLEKFQQCMEYIKDDLKDGNVVIIFSPGIFGMNVESEENNKTILANFTNIKNDRTTNASMYIIAENTPTKRRLACESQTTKDSEFPVIAMYEPTYILLPKFFVLDGANYYGILVSGAAQNEVDLPQSNVRTVGSVSVYLNNSSDRYKHPFLAFPPNIKKGDTIKDYKVFRFSNGAGVPRIINIILKEGDIHGVVLDKILEKNKFMGSDEQYLALDGINYVTVTLAGNKFSMRNPERRVEKNWEELRFTDDEAQMLNTLNLTPRMLQEILGEEWASELATFLVDTINSRCFADTALLTTSECTRSAEFLERIKMYLILHDRRLISPTQYEVEQEEDEGMEKEDIEPELEPQQQPSAAIKEECLKLFKDETFHTEIDTTGNYNEEIRLHLEKNMWIKHIYVNGVLVNVFIPKVKGGMTKEEAIKDFIEIVKKMKANHSNCRISDEDTTAGDVALALVKDVEAGSLSAAPAVATVPPPSAYGAAASVLDTTDYPV